MSALALGRATEFAAGLTVKLLEPAIGAELSGIDLRRRPAESLIG
jgi:hypothetical protein